MFLDKPIKHKLTLQEKLLRDLERNHTIYK